MLLQLLMVIHLLLSLGIIGLVLLQRGKGADAGAGFGAGASGTVFGARGSATFLSKTTGVMVACFFVTSLTLAYLASHRSGANAPKSLIDQVQVPTPAPAPTSAPQPAGGNPLPPPANPPGPAPAK
jgi:preprotein translocase subunit SecG